MDGSAVSFYDDNKGPIALHRVNQYIDRSVGERRRVALVVCDGMAVDQWFLLRDYLLACLKRKVEFRENRAYAIAPTVTSVSRQALFAGRMPGNFPDTVLSPTADADHGQNYWVNRGRRRKRVAYLNLKMAGEFAVAWPVVFPPLPGTGRQRGAPLPRPHRPLRLHLLPGYRHPHLRDGYDRLHRQSQAR